MTQLEYNSRARYMGSSMRKSVIFDCFAGVAAAFEDAESAPTIIELQGLTAEGQGHPSWDWLESKRDPSGRLIPSLLKWYKAGSPERIAIVGFSAGSNSGLRQLLRHPQDREAVSFMASIDGLHPVTSWDGKTLANPAIQFEPFSKYSIMAARSNGYAVFTANNLAPPTTTTWSTPQAMKAINKEVVAKAGNVNDLPTNMAAIREFLAMGGPKPNAMGGIGNCYFFEYPGRTASDHIAQAKTVMPRILEVFLSDAWPSGKTQV